jgi:hypothetical protein
VSCRTCQGHRFVTDDDGKGLMPADVPCPDCSLTAPRPLLTAEDFPHHKFDKAEAKAIADIANAKVAPLQKALSGMRLKCGEWANKVASQDAELERLRARVAELEGECETIETAALKYGAVACRLREALERIAGKDFECGNHCRDVARAALEGDG